MHVHTHVCTQVYEHVHAHINEQVSRQAKAYLASIHEQPLFEMPQEWRI